MARQASFRRLWQMGAVLLLGLMLLPAVPALAHGGAEITVEPAVVVPGGSINVKGEGVEAGEEFTISLQGVGFETTLGTVTVGDDEDFHQEFTIPANVSSGIYQVVAVSGEGETLTAELTVEAGEGAAVPAEPSAALMALDRSKSLLEWGVIGVGLLLSLGLGLVLVRGKS
ncbi:hypothetical protein FKZ61_007705 [Litorilinea aerophila]|uniref:Uncharacterized protein n=1 Tax=Litorilinea aerophila TaxID=1204385 RepID=A0A540VHW6_9CHLR|nr:hypothetical protein [Litorilinea aerophila]MCC9075994.1 hypothetical protein [Litorilinea aerophila]OUC05341.1 hypothetical protein RY27_27870 [Litorilinea aerophila]GIV80273.1 MAG: hypothetical protein KatS3mg050_4667 [Litorilinea sp.]GIV80406.1 MAG: hypothetical protein KatS3mg050_4800 [Litorilinea sp.]